MILVVVYVGAVAVLFLFVVMMLDDNFSELRRRLSRLSADWRVDWDYLAELILVLGSWITSPGNFRGGHRANAAARKGQQYPGAWTVDLHRYPTSSSRWIDPLGGYGRRDWARRCGEPGVRKQKIADQLARQREDAVEVVKVEPGADHLVFEIGRRTYLNGAAILFTLGLFGVFLNQEKHRRYLDVD